MHGVVDELGSITEQLLILGNDSYPPHFGKAQTPGSTPFHWTSINSAVNFQNNLFDHVVYHEEIIRASHYIVSQLRYFSKTQTFNAVHLRRGNFLKWHFPEEASHLSVVKSTIQKYLRTNELFYVATNERDPEWIKGLQEIGGVFWNDLFTTYKISLAEFPFVEKMIMFEMFYGMIEQHIAKHARKFIGSDCSTMTGQILTLRRKIHGAEEYVTLTGVHHRAL